VAPDVKGALPDPTPPTALPDVAPVPALEAEAAEPRRRLPRLARAERARSSAYRARFVLVYFGLAVLAGAAVGALVVVLERPHAKGAAAWSTWKPPGRSESARILQIVDHIPKAYRLTNGKPLVLASVSRPSFATTTPDGQPIEVPVSQITILPALDTVDPANALQVSFCGVGSQTCEVALTPKTATYLRRETLELALYLFRYTSSVESVMFLMPPTSPQTVILIERHDVAKQLARPLRGSLSERTPPLDGISSTESKVIDEVTQPRLYHLGAKQDSSNRLVEVLEPLAKP
jgi:hypothetical protein